jgi:hypothetical protein
VLYLYHKKKEEHRKKGHEMPLEPPNPAPLGEAFFLIPIDTVLPLLLSLFFQSFHGAPPR